MSEYNARIQAEWDEQPYGLHCLLQQPHSHLCGQMHLACWKVRIQRFLSHLTPTAKVDDLQVQFRELSEPAKYVVIHAPKFSTWAKAKLMDDSDAAGLWKEDV